MAKNKSKQKLDKIRLSDLNWITKDESLNEYDDVVLFPDKLNKANRMLKEIGIPKQWKSIKKL